MNCWDRYNHIDRGEATFTLRGDGSGDTCPVAYGFSHSNSNTSMETKPKKECAMTLRSVPTGEGATIQSLGFKAGQSANGGLGNEREVSPTLSHNSSALEPTVAIATILSQMRYIVRRLTPTEAERLMGLPDGYTIPAGLDANDPELVAEFQRIFDAFGAIMADYAHTKPPKPKTAAQVQKWLAKIADPATCPDSPRYKGCGNGMATNQPRWIFTRMLTMEGIEW